MYDLLTENNFKKIDLGQLFAYDENGVLKIGIRSINKTPRRFILEYLTWLKMDISGNETDQELRDLLIRELYKRGQVLKCNQN